MADVTSDEVAATAHFGDPCIYCGTPHDEVAPGPCPGRADYDGAPYCQFCGARKKADCHCGLAEND